MSNSGVDAPERRMEEVFRPSGSGGRRGLWKLALAAALLTRAYPVPRSSQN